MKKYLILLALAITLNSCTKGRKPTTFIINTSKDTSFLLSRSSSYSSTIVCDFKGQLDSKALLVISYYKSKDNKDVKFEIPLDSGKVNINDARVDFYESNALFTFKHLNNKKGQLSITAGL